MSESHPPDIAATQARATRPATTQPAAPQSPEKALADTNAVFTALDGSTTEVRAEAVRYNLRRLEFRRCPFAHSGVQLWLVTHTFHARQSASIEHMFDKRSGGASLAGARCHEDWFDPTWLDPDPPPS
ncbi:MAG: hypothetical protein ACRDRW_16795 [Pseudonocardiaceae bacterium]